MALLTITVNGELHLLEADPQMPLLWFLRDVLDLTGTKYGCGKGHCGSCTVHVDGEAVRTCQATVQQAADRQVLTIEGLLQDKDHPLREAWLAKNVSQCGFCQPGQIMQAAALLARNPKPDTGQILNEMASVLCRCGTYQRIHRAVSRAIERSQA